MRSVIRFFIFLVFISFVSCRGKRSCSGVSPETGSYNTAQKIRKARRHSHSAPEKAAETHRLKVVKNHKSSKLTKTTGIKKGLFHHSSKKGGKKGGGKNKGGKKEGGINIDQKN
jgi:hypothetical protein